MFMSLYYRIHSGPMVQERQLASANCFFNSERTVVLSLWSVKIKRKDIAAHRIARNSHVVG